MKMTRVILASIFGILFSFNCSQALTDLSALDSQILDRPNRPPIARELSLPNENLEIIILFVVIPIILSFIIHYLNISKKRKVILFFSSITILFLIIFVSFNPKEIPNLFSKNKNSVAPLNLSYNKQEANSTCNQENKDEQSTRICELSQLLEKMLSTQYYSSLFLDNKYYIEFDHKETYTFWLYTKVEPSERQARSEILTIGHELDNKFDDYYFDFEIFPQNSKTIPGDLRPYDSFFSLGYRPSNGGYID